MSKVPVSFHQKSAISCIQARRRLAVSQLLLRGFIVEEITAMITELGIVRDDGKPFHASTIYADIKFLYQQWKKEAMENIEELKLRTWAELREIKHRAWQNDELDTVLRAIVQERALWGMDSKQESINVNVFPEIQYIRSEECNRQLTDIEVETEDNSEQ